MAKHPESSHDLSEPVAADEDLQEIDDADAEEVLVLDSQNDIHSASFRDVDTESSLDEMSNRPDDDTADVADTQNYPNGEHLRDDAAMILRKHKSDVFCVASSPSRHDLLASGGQDNVGILWHLEDAVDVGEVDGAGESVSTVAFSVDGAYAAFGSENGAIAIVLLDGSIAPGRPLDGPSGAITFLAWHPRGPILLAGSEDNLSYMWNVKTSAFMTAFAGHEAAVTAGGFSSDGKVVVTVSEDTSLRIWNPVNGQTLRRIQNGQGAIGSAFHSESVVSLSLGPLDTPGAKLAASGCMSGDVYVTQIESGTVVARLSRHEGGVEALAFSPSFIRPVLLATGGGDGKIHIWDAEAGNERLTLQHSEMIVKLIWHPAIPIVTSASTEGTLAVWHGLSGERLAFFTGHTDFITDVCYAANNTMLASSSADGTVRVFDIRHILSAF